MLLLLAHAENHHAALGIGEGAIGRPEILRQRTLPVTPGGKFALQID